jgi:YD repeat-containing protein
MRVCKRGLGVLGAKFRVPYCAIGQWQQLFLRILGVAIAIVMLPAQAAMTDCLGENNDGTQPGTAICTGAIPASAAGSQGDAQGWAYNVSPFDSPMNDWVTWCIAMGGTVSGQSCIGGANGFTDATIVSSALAYWNTRSNCSAGLISDTGWISPTYNGGVVVRNDRSLGIMLSGGACQTPSTTIMSALRARGVTCPSGYTTYTLGSGNIQCRKMPPCDRCDTAGNLIRVFSANKVQSETDIVAGGSTSLRFERIFASAGHFDPTPGNLETAASHWRNSYAQRIVALTGNPNAMAARQDVDGTVRFFASTGSEVANVDGAGSRLVQIMGTAGELTGWRYTSGNGSIEDFNASGQLMRITTPTGVAQTLSYSDATTLPAIAPQPGLLIAIADSFGRAISLTYDNAGRHATATDPLGNTVHYSYDTFDNPVQVTYPDAGSRGYFYEDPTHIYLLTGIYDENSSRYSHYTYEANGYATATELANGVNHYSVSRSSDIYGMSNYVAVTDPNGITYNRQYLAIGGAAKRVAKWCTNCPTQTVAEYLTFDVSGNVVSSTDNYYHTTCYAYDLRNLESKRVEGLPGNFNCTNALSSPPAPTQANPTRVVSTQWHPDWRLEAKRADAKKLATWVYNGQPDPSAGSAVASCAPSSALLPDGKPIAVLCKKIEQATTDATGASGFSATVSGSPRTWTWTYNQYGQVLTAKGPRTDANDTTTYTYYGDTTTDHTLGDLASVINAAGHVTQYTRYDKNGRPLTSIDPNGVVTTLSYSPRGWLTSRQVGTELTTYYYDAGGQLKKVTLPDGSWLGNDYDGAHRLTSSYDNQGNRVTYTLDNAGNRTKEDVTDPTGALVRTQTRIYDALSRLQNVVQPQ